MTQALTRSQIFRAQNAIHDKELYDLREQLRELAVLLEDAHHEKRYHRAVIEAQHNQILTLRSQLDVNA
jgi:hypothetical protein